jgi:hypothetical protein
MAASKLMAAATVGEGLSLSSVGKALALTRRHSAALLGWKGSWLELRCVGAATAGRPNFYKRMDCIIDPQGLKLFTCRAAGRTCLSMERVLLCSTASHIW